MKENHFHTPLFESRRWRRMGASVKENHFHTPLFESRRWWQIGASMNWLLIAVVLILIGFALKGRRDGFIKTIFSIFSVVIALLVTMFVAPSLSRVMQNNEKLFAYVESKVEDALAVDTVKADSQKDQLDIIDKLPLPEGLRKQLAENKNTEVFKAMAVNSLDEYITVYITKMIINAGTFIVFFLILNIALIILANVLNIISRLPVINALNKTAGFLVGILKGLIIIWVLCILLTVFSSTQIAGSMYKMINESELLSFLYNHNMILKSVADVVKGLK